MSNDVKYIDHIDAVAFTLGHHCTPLVLEQRLKDTWTEFEIHAAKVGYDVFLSKEKNVALHELMELLVELLYRVDRYDVVNDMDFLRAKDKDYGGSWCQRGGPGAFMMLARKWDRIAKALRGTSLSEVLKTDTRDESVSDDIGDLRRYLILVLAWHAAKNAQEQIEMTF